MEVYQQSLKSLVHINFLWIHNRKNIHFITIILFLFFKTEFLYVSEQIHT